MDKELKIILGVFTVFVVAVVAIGWFASAMEARSYRKFCDTPVTTWDAFWLDLRIDGCGQ